MAASTHPQHDEPHIHVIATQHLDVAYLWRRHPDGEVLMRQCFERAIEISEGKTLMAKVIYARQYARLVFDQELHDRLLQEVLVDKVHQRREHTGRILNGLLSNPAKFR